MILYFICISLLTIIPLLLTIAFFTLAERKIIAAIQRRKGPNIVGYWGILQPFADALKLVLKEINIPYQATKTIFLGAPYLIFFLSLINYAFLPTAYTDIICDTTYSLLYFYLLSSLSVYSLVFAGQSSKSKYPFLGAIRSAAQIISYEVSIGLILIIIVLITRSLNILDIVYQQFCNYQLIFIIFPLFIVFLISIIAETNRAPFDLPEAEAEIVAGYNLEYSSVTFAFFFLGEYGNIILINALTTLLFLGGQHFLQFSNIQIFYSKIGFLCFLFILIRAALPRYRYDQLIKICQQIFMPLNLLYLCWVLIVII